MVASQAGDVVCLHCDATHSGSANTSDAYRYFVTSYIGQPTRVLRQDWAEAEGPRDNLGCDAINALVAEAGHGESAQGRRVRHRFGRL